MDPKNIRTPPSVKSSLFSSETDDLKVEKEDAEVNNTMAYLKTEDILVPKQPNNKRNSFLDTTWALTYKISDKISAIIKEKMSKPKEKRDSEMKNRQITANFDDFMLS